MRRRGSSRARLDIPRAYSPSHGDPKPLKLMPQAIDRTTSLAVKRILCDIRHPRHGDKSALVNVEHLRKNRHRTHQPRQKRLQRDAAQQQLHGRRAGRRIKLVVMMVIHEPDKSASGHYGGVVSGPAAGRILERALAYLEVPSSPDLPPPPPEIASVLWGYNAKLYTDRTARAE